MVRSPWLIGLTLLGFLLTPTLASAKHPAQEPILSDGPLTAAGSATHIDHATDLALTKNHIWVATSGGLVVYRRSDRTLLHVFGKADGLPSTHIERLVTTRSGLFIASGGKTCSITLTGKALSVSRCRAHTTQTSAPLAPEIHQGSRVTARARGLEGHFFATTSGVYLEDRRLGSGASQGLSGPHVTAITTFKRRLYVGTFNHGVSVAPVDTDGASPVFSLAQGLDAAGRQVNALLATANALYVGTSRGLFRSSDGSNFSQVTIVEDSVTGLSFDQTSVWAATPGAVYRVSDGSGPKSDVWWMPGGSRSLQKLDADRGQVWIASEDRGAILMRTSRRTVSSDRPFEVFDFTSSLPSSWALSVSPFQEGAVVATLRDGAYLVGKSGSTKLKLPVGDWGLSTLKTSGGLFIGTQDGAAYFDQATRASERIQGLPDERVHAFHLQTPVKDAKRVRLWIGTENGLAWLWLPRGQVSTT